MFLFSAVTNVWCIFSNDTKVNTEIGGNAALPCQITLPVIKLRWRKENEFLTDDLYINKFKSGYHRLQINAYVIYDFKNISNYELTILNVTSLDFGVYCCVVQGYDETNEKCINLMHEGKFFI